MHPAFSVIFLTTLIGVGQGLLLALFSAQAYGMAKILPAQPDAFFATGSFIALLFLLGGLFAAVFHLGKPSYFITRAWRGMSQWRTSWLSRELIALPIMIGLTFIYMAVYYFGLDADLYGWGVEGQLPLTVGIATAVAAIGLFVCTGMIYAAVKFLQEWACALTPVNYFLLGTASGFTLATWYAAGAAPGLVQFFGTWAIVLTLAGLVTRAAALFRNGRIKRKSTMQTAIGVRHTKVQQKSMGMMGGAYNTREYFHGATVVMLKSVKWAFLVLTFAVPLLMLWAGLALGDGSLFLLAFVAQYVGLLFERWFFFAQANHPQNLYYQIVG
ncbi:MAG: dimethyl sulfoxide reductase anchor subunit [Betaproteobacteria bacterium]|nr:dimethyl sulfoxide reductase anchor subunit [Betaproteobacteria bacterium]